MVCRLADIVQQPTPSRSEAIIRLTALLPPPPTPITSMRADWLGTMPVEPLLEAGVIPSAAISMESAKPVLAGSIISFIPWFWRSDCHSFGQEASAGTGICRFRLFALVNPDRINRTPPPLGQRRAGWRGLPLLLVRHSPLLRLRSLRRC